MFNTLASYVTGSSGRMNMKPLKVRSDNGNSIGIVAQNLRDAINKGKLKLKISNNDTVTVVLEDGTEVDSEEYFGTLQPQTTLVFLRSGETLTSGLDKKYKSKSSYMRYLAQKRIRNYYNTAKDQIKEEKDPEVKGELLKIFEQIQNELKNNKEHGYYFDRSSSEDKLCDGKGWFTCEGPFDEETCKKSHRINPYASKRRRVVFSQWNLDHIIEKKRQVIPRLIEAAKKKDKTKRLNYKKVYTLLFTKTNLRLVQYDCHKKEARDQTIDIKEFYS
ncbi:hypothetical protein Btru_036214 [Bulinus truncatus]|nr:hypothetical protein Btru_036214 [Bulinus truncatus]